MTIYGWPFLVTSNRILDYRAVVAPDFMVDADASEILFRETPGEPNEHPTFRELSDTKAGDLTLAYRVVFATEGSERLKDSIGRPILRIEGFVARGHLRQLFAKNEAVVRNQLLPEARKRVEQEFLGFWNSSITNPSIKRSEAFSTGLEEARNPRGRPYLRALVAFGIAAVLGTTLALILIPDDPLDDPDPEVRLQRYIDTVNPMFEEALAAWRAVDAEIPSPIAGAEVVDVRRWLDAMIEWQETLVGALGGVNDPTVDLKDAHNNYLAAISEVVTLSRGIRDRLADSTDFEIRSLENDPELGRAVILAVDACEELKRVAREIVGSADLGCFRLLP